MRSTINLYDDLDRVFELIEVNNKQVILEVKADSPLTVAQFPFVSMQMKYITVTRGREHQLVIINNDGSQTNFSWGDSGYTIIGDNSKMLKVNVIKFIEDNGILIDCTTTVVRDPAKIFFNHNFGEWQLTLGAAYYKSKTAKNVMDMINECKKFVVADNWRSRKAQTGIDMWEAVNQKIVYR